MLNKGNNEKNMKLMSIMNDHAPKKFACGHGENGKQ